VARAAGGLAEALQCRAPSGGPGNRQKGPSFSRISRLQFLFPLNDSPAPSKQPGGPSTGRQLAMLAMPDPNYQKITVDLFPAPCKILDLQRENGSHPL
jgi:hypothetical protein